MTATTFLEDCALTAGVVKNLEQAWAPLAEAPGPWLLIAEGSSRLVPLGLAKRFTRAIGTCLIDGCSGRLAPNDWPGTLVALSNSGKTREVYEALHGKQYLAITGLADGPLTKEAHASIAVLPRPEQAVAATASVIGQSYVLLAALAAKYNQQLETPSFLKALEHIHVPELPEVKQLWIVGADDGVAEELALKAWETAGMPAAPVATGLALHGMEEVLGAGHVVWVIESAASDRTAIEDRIHPTQATLLFLETPDIGHLTPLLRLATGWQWLAQWALRKGRDPAIPTRARKIGNEIT
ncbi:MAG: hypothetical protein MJH10_15615 [Epibacterium sp.]|nr:hypothetical protein [Epibacterium sp.]NQX74945.1 hypothetical protein [Epibacterium sp.]